MRRSIRFLVVWLLAVVVTQSVVAAKPPGLMDRGALVAPPGIDCLIDALKQAVSVDFQGKPLEEALETLGGQVGTAIRLDLPALAELHIKPLVPVSLKVDDVSLHSTLGLLLHDLDLVATIRNGMITVTSSKKGGLEACCVTRVYHVNDLANPNGDQTGLTTAITQSIRPLSWNGKPGTISRVVIDDAKMLVVGQSPLAHEEIASFLAALRCVDRQAYHQQPSPMILLEEFGTKVGSVATIRGELAKEVSLDWDQTRLETAVSQLRNCILPNVDVCLDRKALIDLGTTVDIPITFHAKNLPLEEALRSALEQYNLAFVIRNEVLVITSSRAAVPSNLVGIHPVTDLTTTQGDCQQLIDTLTLKLTDPSQIRTAPFLRNARVLVINQTREVHEEINALFEALRAVKGS